MPVLKWSPGLASGVQAGGQPGSSAGGQPGSSGGVQPGRGSGFATDNRGPLVPSETVSERPRETVLFGKR